MLRHNLVLVSSSKIFDNTIRSYLEQLNNYIFNTPSTKKRKNRDYDNDDGKENDDDEDDTIVLIRRKKQHGGRKKQKLCPKLWEEEVAVGKAPTAQKLYINRHL